MTSQRFASVWDAIERDPAAAQDLKQRSHLMTVIGEHIRRSTMSPIEAAQLFGVDLGKAEALMCGKINSFSADDLTRMVDVLQRAARESNRE